MTREQKRSLLLIAAAAVLLIGLHFVPVTGWLKLVLYLIPYLLVGGETLVDACKGIYNRQPFDENLLMAVATIGAMVLGDYPEAVSVMLFYQIGELFESYAVGRSRRNIGDLMDIRPDYANVETADGVARVKPEQVAVGDTIVVKPGERVPLDGTVLTGTSALNMSALTGESAPVDVAEGSTVVSGSVNLSGVLRLRVEKVYAESTVARILELVENSSLKKAHTERFITKFARVYTPSVCGAALALAILPPVVRLIMGIPAEWGDWIYRALTFLVISCPCALVISIPLSFFGGIGGASARGILIKGSSYLEMLAKTDRVVFDKTGTLTRGTFAVTAVHPAQPELSDQALLQLAAAAEQFSDHPVSQSLRRAAGELPADLVTTDAKELAGHGVTAQVGGRSVAAGNTKLMDTLGLTVPAVNETGTVIHVAADGAYLGYIVISDEPKTGSREAVARLRADGVRVVMLTGDRKSAADAVAEELGIAEVHSELLPEDKVTQVERLLGEGAPGKYLAFVGDGINDAPALAKADLGMAIGAGTDVAIESADAVLMRSDLLDAVSAIRLSKAVIKNIKENLFWAFFYNVICIPLAAGVLYPAFGIRLNPMIGAAAMSLSSFTVCMNALRLRFFKTTHSTDVSRETSAPETSSPKAAQAAPQTPVPEVAAVPAPYHYTLSIEGMMCQHCVATVTKVLKAMDGVTDAVVDLDGQKADVSADKAISAEDFKKVITTAGYTLQNLTTPKKEEDETMEKTLKIEGMMCQHCQKHVHDALAAMDGVTAVTVDLEGKKADVTASKDIPTEAFAKVIADAGYELVK